MNHYMNHWLILIEIIIKGLNERIESMEKGGLSHGHPHILSIKKARDHLEGAFSSLEDIPNTDD